MAQSVSVSKQLARGIILICEGLLEAKLSNWSSPYSFQQLSRQIIA